MARPKTGQTPPISFRPPPQLLVEFDATIEEGRTRSDVLIELMHDRINRKRREQTASAPARPDKPGPIGPSSTRTWYTQGADGLPVEELRPLPEKTPEQPGEETT